MLGLDMATTIRPARPGDEEHIFRLLRELARFEKLEHELTGSAEALGVFLFGERPAAEALVAVRDNTLIGYALFFTTFSTFLTRPGIYLEDLYVTEAERGTGVGKALLRGVAEVACARDAGRLEWSVLDWNKVAIDFYVASGAKLMDDWRICRVTGPELARLGVQPTASNV
jgi:GNAT superfamily N-acetyltransferase